MRMGITNLGLMYVYRVKSRRENYELFFFFDKNIDFEISLAFDVVESECYRRVCHHLLISHNIDYIVCYSTD